MDGGCAIRMRGITKSFGKVLANDAIDLDLRKGEILSLLGENGSGKTTLMNMLAGIYQPDAGKIFAGEKRIYIHSPKDAYGHGIGMIHQHYKLVDVFTAAQNIVLGLKDAKLDMRRINSNVRKICDRYAFNIDPAKKIYDMSISQKQTVEIVKVLYRGADILILDEPTAVLTPQETERLFAVMRNMKADGKAIVIITHKLNEVMEISDEVAVLRKGRFIGRVRTSETSPQALTNMMVGHQVTLNIERLGHTAPFPRLKVDKMTCFDREGVKKLDGVSFTAMGGEILGVAGVAGSGQKELLEGIAGLYPVRSGSIRLLGAVKGAKDGKAEKTAHGAKGGKAEKTAHGGGRGQSAEKELVGLTPMQIRKTGVGMAFVPEDRLGMGLVGSMGMTGNMMLRSWRKGKGIFLNRKSPQKLAREVLEELEVVTPSTEFPVRKLSGGNVQKVLVGREIASQPQILMAAYPVRGLDINTSYTIYNLLTREKMKGVAVVYVGEDLDVLLELCDRILVLCDGQVSGLVDARKASKEEIGLMMTSVGGKGGPK